MSCHVMFCHLNLLDIKTKKYSVEAMLGILDPIHMAYFFFNLITLQSTHKKMIEGTDNRTERVPN